MFLTMYSRYRTGELPEQVASLSVADMWITHLAFSTWYLVQPGCCKLFNEWIGQCKSYTKYR